MFLHKLCERNIAWVYYLVWATLWDLKLFQKKIEFTFVISNDKQMPYEQLIHLSVSHKKVIFVNLK